LALLPDCSLDPNANACTPTGGLKVYNAPYENVYVLNADGFDGNPDDGVTRPYGHRGEMIRLLCKAPQGSGFENWAIVETNASWAEPINIDGTPYNEGYVELSVFANATNLRACRPGEDRTANF
jgi:hypothetical protein